MQSAVRLCGALPALRVVSLAVVLAACGDDDHSATTGAFQARLDTTPLCPLVAPPRAGAPPTALRPYGTDLGFSYAANGTVTLLFGDTWPDIATCPIRLNDDSIASLTVPPDWPGFTAGAPLGGADCPQLDFVLSPDGNAVAPIELRRWDGVPVPLGPLNTPVAAFYDGTREWGVFIVAGGLPCSADDAEHGRPCPATLDPQAGDLTCGFVGMQPSCLDLTSTQTSADGRLAIVLHIAERTGPSSYVARAVFVTNKFLNFTARTVRSYNPENSRGRDYGPGSGALLAWGRPGFDSKGEGGEAPPYLLYHTLPFEVVGEQILFHPHFFRGTTASGTPEFVADQAAAAPLYTHEFDPVMQMAVSYVAALRQWIMLYGGDVPDVLNGDGNDPDHAQPHARSIHARFAPDPWGPWTDPQPILTREAAAPYMVCDPQGNPSGCLPPPTPIIRPQCLEAVDRAGFGHLYGPNVLDTLTRAASPVRGRGPAADVFWNVSTWHPYGVVLVKTHIERE